MMDEQKTIPETPAEPTSETPGAGRDPGGESWAAQLQRMIDDISRQAAPVVREVAAKAAELAAIAGEKAGPLAQKAAVKTQEFGAMVAVKGKEMAADLRRATGEAGHDGNGAAPAGAAPAAAAPEAPAGAEAPTEENGA
jgi:hypothetical protein